MILVGFQKYEKYMEWKIKITKMIKAKH